MKSISLIAFLAGIGLAVSIAAGVMLLRDMVKPAKVYAAPVQYTPKMLTYKDVYRKDAK